MERFLWMLLECTLTMTLLAAVMLLIMPLWTRRYSARSAYVAWLILLAGFLVLYRPHPAPAPLKVSVQPMQAQRVVVMPRSDPDVYSSTLQAKAPVADSTPIAPAKAAAPRINVSMALGSLWAAGALLALSTRLWRHQRFLRSVRRWSKPVDAPDTLAILTAEREKLGIRRPIAVKVCRSIDSPMLIGMVRPVILLPDLPLSPEALRLVLRHELIHHQRGDLWGRVLMLLAASAHWFNPLMGAFIKAATFQCEASCDALVMAQMDMDARQHYSETILALLRKRGAVSTALSTRYSGGKRTVKKRILSILDMRPKKLGIFLVALMLAAAIGAAFAFALATETRTPLTLADRGMQTDIHRREQSFSIYEKLEKQAELSRQLDGLLDAYNIEGGYSVVNVLDWTELETKLAACKSASDLADILTLSYILPDAEDHAALDAHIDAIIAATGASPLPRRSYSPVYSPSYGEQTFLWSILAYADDPESGFLSLLLTEDYQLMKLTPQYIASFEKTTAITDAEREFVRDSAIAYAKAYTSVSGADAEVTMVSDIAFTDALAEPYALVWIFTHAYNDDGITPVYAKDVTKDNRGNELAVGVTSGRVYSLVGEISEATFVNEAQAGKDWVANTGLSYPYYDEQYLTSYVSRSITSLIEQLREQYEDALTPQEKLIARHISNSIYASLSPACEWEALEAALCACESAEDFQALLNADYLGINRPYAEDAMQLADYAAHAETYLDLLGWNGLPDRSFVYSSGYSMDEGMEVYAADMTRATTNDRLPGVVITIRPDGRLGTVGGGSMIPEKPIGLFDDLPKAQRDAVTERVLTLVNACATEDENPSDEVRFADNVYDNMGISPLVFAWVRTSEWVSESGEQTFPYGVEVVINPETLQVYQLYNGQGEESFEWNIRQPDA